MSEGIKRFEELLRTDSDFQEKLKAAAESYTGELNDEAVFHNVLVPFAREYGITATYDEFKAYIDQQVGADSSISDQELTQIAGGAKGYGMVGCYVIGAGMGGSGGGGKGGACLFVGAGWGGSQCTGSGFTDDIDIGSLIS